MKIYCKKIEEGTFFDVPMDWEVKSYQVCGRYYQPVEKKPTNAGFRLVNGFFMVHKEPFELPTSLQQTCDFIYQGGLLSGYGAEKYFLLSYYNFGNFCLLTANENYFKDTADETIEVS